ncbi:UNVERIFIED_CONTAM: hypothetical protein HDU68_005504, partial [Siphonaria sp. JEL0065]
QQLHYKFRTTNAYTVSKLMFHNQDRFNQTLTCRAGVDEAIVFELQNGIYQGLGPTGVHSLQRQKATRLHDLKERAYYLAVESLLHEQILQSSAGIPKVSDPGSEIPRFPSFKDSDYDGGYPSVNYLKRIFVKDNTNRRDWLDFEVQRRHEQVLSIGHYYKICKHLAPINGHRLFKALFTGKNEYREIRLQALTQTSAHFDLTPLFRSYELTRKFYGYASLALCYTDKCCSDRAFLQSVLEQVLPPGSAIPLLPLPENPLCICLLSTERPEEITIALARVVEHIRALPCRNQMPLGLDTEWNMGPNGKEGKIQLLQLADICEMARLCKRKGMVEHANTSLAKVLRDCFGLLFGQE